MNIKTMNAAFQVKSLNDDGTFTGYGSIFNTPDDVKDIVQPGAFKKSLAEHQAKGRMPALLWHHNHREPIGVYLEMKEDAHGLFVRGQLLKDQVQKAAEVYALMKAGAISGLSIGYSIRVDEYNRDTGETKLIELDLWEVSPVTFPCHDDARVNGVKDRDQIKTERDFENFLRDSGFSKSDAIGITSRGFKLRDSAAKPPDLSALIKTMRG